MCQTLLNSDDSYFPWNLLSRNKNFISYRTQDIFYNSEEKSNFPKDKAVLIKTQYGPQGLNITLTACMQ